MGNGKRSAKLNKLTLGRRFLYYLLFSTRFFFCCGKLGRDLKQTFTIMMVSSGIINVWIICFVYYIHTTVIWITISNQGREFFCTYLFLFENLFNCVGNYGIT